MILSLNLFAFINRKPNFAAFESAKKAGFNDITIEFNVTKEDVIADDNFEPYIKELKNLLDSMELTVSQTHLRSYSFAQGSSVKSEEIDKQIERSIISSAILGAPWGAIHPRTSYDVVCDRKYNLTENIKFIEPFLKTAEKYRVGIAVENIPTWRDAEKNVYFSSHHTELIDLIDYFGGHEYLGICWDTGHANLNMHCQNQFQAIREIGHRLKTIHLASNDGRYDDHLMPPAFGTVDCEKLASALNDVGFDGVLSCEIHGTDFPGTDLGGALDSYNKLNYACGKYLMDLLEK